MGDNGRGMAHRHRRRGQALFMRGRCLRKWCVMLRRRLLLLLVLLKNLFRRYLVDHFFVGWLRDEGDRWTPFQLRLMMYDVDHSEACNELYRAGTSVKGSTHFSVPVTLHSPKLVW